MLALEAWQVHEVWLRCIEFSIVHFLGRLPARVPDEIGSVQELGLLALPLCEQSLQSLLTRVEAHLDSKFQQARQDQQAMEMKQPEGAKKLEEHASLEKKYKEHSGAADQERRKPAKKMGDRGARGGGGVEGSG